MKEDVNEAILFFQLEKDFQAEDLKKKFRELAFKYHPDRGEYTSNTLFTQLLEYKSILEEYLEHNEIPTPKEKEQSSKNLDYQIYKEAKKIENAAILAYFQSRKKALTMVLEKEKNPQLQELQIQLEKAKNLYNQLLEKFPDSIWTRDAVDSLESMKVWFR